MTAIFLSLAILTTTTTFSITAIGDTTNPFPEEQPISITETEEKIPCTATIDDDFEEGVVLVVIKKEFSEINKEYTPEDFPEINCTEVKDLFYLDDPDNALINREKFRNISPSVYLNRNKPERLDNMVSQHRIFLRSRYRLCAL